MTGSNFLPEGEHLRRAIRWVSQTCEAFPERKRFAVIQEAELKFDLSPIESLYLQRTLLSKPQD